MKKIHRLLAVAGIALTVCSTGCKSKPPQVRITSAEMAENAFVTSQWESASAYYTDAITEEGQRYNYYFNRGICYKNLGRHQEALNDFAKASKLYPNDKGKSLVEAARAAIAITQYEKAVEYTDQVLTKIPSHAEAKGLRYQALLRHAKASYAQKNYRAAIKSLDTYLKTGETREVIVLKAECLFLNAKTKIERSDANIYIKKVVKGLPKKSSEWLKIQKMYAQNLFFLRHAKTARSEYTIYMDVRKNNVSPDDIFWAGLMAQVNLDKETQNKYWSKIGKAYLAKQLKSLKSAQGVN